MTIAYVLDTNIDFPGGVQRFVKGLYNYIVHSGHEAVVFTSGKVGESERRGYNVRRLGLSCRLSGNDTRVDTYLGWVGRGKVRQFLKRERVDILHLQAFFGPLGASFLSASNLPSVATFHNYYEAVRMPFIYRLAFPLARHYIGKVDVCVADSFAAREFACRICPRECEIIPPGIGAKRLFAVVPKRIFGGDMFQILYVGRLDERKGIFYLLKALKKVQGGLPKVSLTVVGEGPLRKSAELFVRDEGIRNVNFLGFVSDEELPSIYRGSDVFCSPATHGECFGIVLLEGMAAGLPVVAFDNAGYRSVLVGEGSELLVKNRDVDALAKVLSRLIEDKVFYQRMSKWSLSDVKKYDWEVVGERYLEIYRRLLRGEE
ncbi:glycosyltransferase family 4 protein [Patescibacteria group bacterium]|nr:glycosyltransferase family 4 protein [Patescibacteria group bacterium]